MPKATASRRRPSRTPTPSAVPRRTAQIDHASVTKANAATKGPAGYICTCDVFCHGIPTTLTKRRFDDHQRRRELDRLNLEREQAQASRRADAAQRRSDAKDRTAILGARATDDSPAAPSGWQDEEASGYPQVEQPLQDNTRARGEQSASPTASRQRLEELSAGLSSLVNSFSLPANLDFSPNTDSPVLLYTSRNAPVHAQELEFTRLLQDIDAVDSGGDVSTRAMRKDLVLKVQRESADLQQRLRIMWQTDVDGQDMDGYERYDDGPRDTPPATSDAIVDHAPWFDGMEVEDSSLNDDIPPAAFDGSHNPVIAFDAHDTRNDLQSAAVNPATSPEWEGWGDAVPTALEVRFEQDGVLDGRSETGDVDSETEELDTRGQLASRGDQRTDALEDMDDELEDELDEILDDAVGPVPNVEAPLARADERADDDDAVLWHQKHPAWNFPPAGEPIRVSLEGPGTQTVFFRVLMLAVLFHSHYHTSIESIAVYLSTLSPIILLLHSILSIGIGAIAPHLPSLAFPGMPIAGTKTAAAPLPDRSVLLSIATLFDGLVPGLGAVPRFPRSLKTCLKYLGIHSNIYFGVVCPRVRCRYVYYGRQDELPDVCTRPRCKTALFWTRNTRKGPKRIPRLVYPYGSIAEQFARFVQISGVEDDCDGCHNRREARRKHARPGDMSDISDGDVWDSLLGPDGLPFWREKGTIYLMIGGDWFHYQRSLGAATYTSGPIPAFIANLSPARRLKRAFMMLLGVIGGRFEPDFLQIIRFYEPAAAELEKLFRDGLWVTTPKHPEGRLFRFACCCLNCDFLGAAKIAGYLGHHCDNPCHRCWVLDSDWLAEDPQQRTAEDHLQHAEEIRNAITKTKKEELAKEHGLRDAAFNRLSYWDPIKMTIIEAMHCLFLGLVRNHWFNLWIGGNDDAQAKKKDKVIFRKGQELRTFYEIRDTILVPSWMPSLPEYVGQPSGGSLSADQWRYLACVYGPLIVPVIFDIYSRPEHKYHNERLYADDLENFLRLCSIVRTCCRRTINRFDDIPWLRAEFKLYSEELAKRWKYKCLKPNHHSAKHIPDDMEGYGPSPEAMAWAGERVNKISKSFHFNNRDGGIIETTMLRENYNAAGLFGLLMSPPATVSDADRSWCQSILKTLRTTRETIGSALSSMVNEPVDDSVVDLNGTVVILGKNTQKQLSLDDNQYNYLWTHLHRQQWAKALKSPDGRTIRLCHDSEDTTNIQGPVANVSPRVQWIRSVTINGRTIHASSHTNSTARDCLIEASYRDSKSSIAPFRAGEVTDIFVHRLKLPDGMKISRVYAVVRFYVLYIPDEDKDISYPWSRWPRLDVRTYKENCFVKEDFQCLVPIQDVRCQVARATVPITPAGRKKVWATVSLLR